ncbi:tip elongation aberrant protein 1-like isoform X3 [Ornithorhynchus anatinus]|nr:tip elongation aberrant protein 1-like isoform X3 [Ornithorhynchus anatinus]XP_039769372.1 tip elongation aberrant protein 1-like isoform X3 [Ornithorhynchus anatinus]
MVAYRGTIYVFGGMVESAFSQRKTPLWMYEIDASRWTEWQKPGSAQWDTSGTHRSPPQTSPWLPAAPRTKQNLPILTFQLLHQQAASYSACSLLLLQPAQALHTSLPCSQGDRRAPLKKTREWAPLSLAPGDPSPGPRHGHSAVVYGSGMYLFGGLMGLMEQKDFWRWNFTSSTWSNIKAILGPPKVVGHSSLIFQDAMLIVGGGIPNSGPHSSMWRFDFGSHVWKRPARPFDTIPAPKTHLCVVGLGRGFQPTVPQASSTTLSLPQPPRWRAPWKRPGGFSIPGEHSAEIEMKILTQTFSQNYSANQAQKLTKEEPLPHPRTEAAAEGFQEERGTKESPLTSASNELPVMLMIGGKPLASSAEITLWRLKFPDN